MNQKQTQSAIALHFAEIGTYLGLDNFRFISGQNMLEYDMIATNLAEITEELRHENNEWVRYRIEDLKEFSLRKDMPIVIFYNASDYFLDEAGINCSLFELLDIQVDRTSDAGQKIEVNPSSHLAAFMEKYKSDFRYKQCFSRPPGTSIGFAKGRNEAVGFYTRDFVILPSIFKYNGFKVSDFVDDLYSVCKTLRSSAENGLDLPAWTADYLLPGERKEIDDLQSIEDQIAALEIARQESKSRLMGFLPLKRLWSESGGALESAVQEAFRELGFKLLTSEPGRNDILMEWKKKPVVVEVKGLSKSAAEKNAAQLEKWVSIHLENNEVRPKALLVVNTYRNQPLADRLNDSFPSQMLPYAKSREHALITTLQLCNLLLYCRAQPKKAKTEVDYLLSVCGIYDKFQQWNERIETASLPQEIDGSES